MTGADLVLENLRAAQTRGMLWGLGVGLYVAMAALDLCDHYGAALVAAVAGLALIVVAANRPSPHERMRHLYGVAIAFKLKGSDEP